jgi:hypothetical protein
MIWSRRCVEPTHFLLLSSRIFFHLLLLLSLLFLLPFHLQPVFALLALILHLLRVCA